MEQVNMRLKPQVAEKLAKDAAKYGASKAGRAAAIVAAHYANNEDEK